MPLYYSYINFNTTIKQKILLIIKLKQNNFYNNVTIIY